MRHTVRTLITPHTLYRIGVGVFLVLAFIFISLYTYTRVGGHEHVSAQASETINFQARLLTSSGSIVPDGDYSVEFQLYDQESNGTSQWSETQTVSVKAGYLSAYLGDSVSFPGAIDWSQQQWLTMNVESDGEMSPRIRLTAVPFAFRASLATEALQADGITSGIDILEADDLLQTAPASIQEISSSDAGLRLNQTSTGGLVQLQGDGSNRFVVDKAGTVTISGGLQLGSTATTNAGMIRWTGTDFEGYDGASWVSLMATGGGSGLEFVQDGNNFGETAVLGTTDGFGLNLITNGVTRLSIANSGEVTVSDGLSVTSGGVSADSFTGSGAGLTDLDAGAIATGTLDDGRLSTNIARLDGVQTFSGLTTFSSGAVIGNTASTASGTLRWTGTDFEGYDGSEWVSFTQGAGIAELALGMFSAYDSGGEIDITTTWADVPLDTQERADNEFTHTVDTAPVTIEEPGWYEISYSASAYTNAGGSSQATVATRLQEDTGAGFATIAGSTGSDFLVSGGSDANMSGSAIREYVIGDEIKLQMQRSGGDAITISTRPDSVRLTIRHIKAAEAGGGGSGLEFVQGGNAFGATAIIGTTDTQGLDIVADGSVALSFSSAGLATFSNQLSIDSGGIDVTGNSTIDGTLSGLSGLTVDSGGVDLTSSGITNTGSITGVGANITASNGLSIASGNGNNLTLAPDSGLLVFDASTWQRTASGSTAIELNDSADTTLEINNIQAGVANLAVQGSVTASAFSGSGSGLSALNASNVTSGTLVDGVLSGNVALLNQAQSFSDLNTFSGGLVVGNTASTTTGAIRWNGVDFEGYDGSAWVSLTQGSGGGATLLEGVLAFGKSAANGSSLSIDGASVARNSTGYYTVTLDSAAASDDYITQITIDDATTGNENITASVANQTTTSFDVYVRQVDSAGNGSTLVDAIWHFIAFDETASAGGGSGSSGLEYVQNGNAFGATALLGTTDTQGVSIITDGVVALAIDAVGDAVFSGALSTNDDLLVQGDGAFQGGLITIGTAVQDGALALHSGSSTAQIEPASLSQNRTYTLPDQDGTICLSSGNCSSGDFVENGGNTTAGTLIIGTETAQDITLKTSDVNRLTIDTSGNVDLLTGGLQTLGTTRLTSGGALQNITGLTIISGGANITGGISIAGGATISSGGIDVTGNSSVTGTLSTSNTLTISAGGLNVSGGLSNNSGGITNAGAVSGATTITASGTINTTGGGLQTNSVTRLTNGGALQNISTITTTGNINTGGVFQVGGVSGVSGSCTGGNNAYLNNITVNGGIITSADCRQGGSLSDVRLKENIVSLEASILDGVSLINTVNFDFKCEDPEYAELNLDCEQQTGVIAQELAEIFPELVYQGDDGYYRVKYDALNIYTLRAVSEVAKRVDSDGNVSAKTVKTNNTVRMTSDGQLTNINGLSLVSGGASITGGIDNNLGGISNVGTIQGVTNINAQTLTLAADQQSDALVINKDGEDALTIADDGALRIMASSANALRIQNSAGDDVFNIDSENGLVYIGSPTAQAKTVLLVLSGRDEATDPPGVNGAQYYNNAMNRFRCYQEDRWQDCISAPISEYILLTSSVEAPISSELAKLHNSSEVWIDAAAARQAQLQVETAFLGDVSLEMPIEKTTCQVEYRDAASSLQAVVWLSSNVAVDINPSSNVAISGWMELPADMPAEVVVRLSCMHDTAANQPLYIFNSARLQLR